MDFSKSSLILLDAIGLESFPFFSFSFSFFFPLVLLFFSLFMFPGETGANEIRDYDCDDGWRMKSHFGFSTTFSCGRGNVGWVSQLPI